MLLVTNIHELNVSEYMGTSLYPRPSLSRPNSTSASTTAVPLRWWRNAGAYATPRITAELSTESLDTAPISVFTV